MKQQVNNNKDGVDSASVSFTSVAALIGGAFITIFAAKSLRV
jgi:hypothetical protein